MKGPAFWFSLVLAFGLIILMAEVTPEGTNVFLLLIIMGVLLSRWAEFAPVLNTLRTLTGAEELK